LINPNVEVFNRDVASNDGYRYTTNIRLSSQLATQRSTDTILGLERFTDRAVIDVGCGDGFYTLRFWDAGRPRSLSGVDSAERAIALANVRKGDRAIDFRVGDAHELPYPDNSFDLALVQSILHHDENPQDIIREAFRVAPEILIHEPNGYNVGLKVIERLSPYHREHRERSYTTWQVARWIEQAGGRVIRRRFAGFVPMFSPDPLARAMKTVEPVVERTPFLKTLGCAVYVRVASRDEQRSQ
jgi:ubiquinone/menaquinone biosynthesis C-methylase UbiE